LFEKQQKPGLFEKPGFWEIKTNSGTRLLIKPGTHRDRVHISGLFPGYGDAGHGICEFVAEIQNSRVRG
jgi:hypothetical protein